MQSSKIKKKIPNYKNLFETLNKKQFLYFIFCDPRFAELYSSAWDNSLTSKCKKLSEIFTYFNKDDLYKYFEINHSLHKNKSKLKYIFTLFHLLTDLSSSVSPSDFEELKDIYTSDSIYIYNQSPDVIPELNNIIRDLFYCGYSLKEIRIKYGYNPKYFRQVLKKVYQEDLTPLDITF